MMADVLLPSPPDLPACSGSQRVLCTSRNSCGISTLIDLSWASIALAGATTTPRTAAGRGEGRAVKTLVLAALIANLVALCATYDQEPEQSGWHLTLPVDGGVWAWVEWGSAVVLVLEVLLQAMAGSFLPWLLDVRHLLRLLLAVIVTLSLVHPHVSLRAMRTIVILRVRFWTEI